MDNTNQLASNTKLKEPMLRNRPYKAPRANSVTKMTEQDIMNHGIPGRDRRTIMLFGEIHCTVGQGQAMELTLDPL